MVGRERDEFLYAVEMARALHDPAADWEAFRDTLWSFLTRVLGLEDGEVWPDDLPDPARRVSGDATAVATWMRERLEPGQSSIPIPRA